jgi:hypothetical protein
MVLLVVIEGYLVVLWVFLSKETVLGSVLGGKMSKEIRSMGAVMSFHLLLLEPLALQKPLPALTTTPR